MKELTILMPCLNEEETLQKCIVKANKFLIDHSIDGEVLIADNGSTDSSIEIALSNHAKVVNIVEKGYGNALIGGILSSNSKYVIMGDSDDSYDFSELNPFLNELRLGADLVMGNRFKGGIKPNAMPFLHKYLGNPVLSFIGRLFFKAKIGDFHCGLRGFSREKMISLHLGCTGMEFASEMIVKASLNNYKIKEVPTILYPDGRSRPPHLRTWRDGWRHLRFLLMFSPKWLFLIPGILFFSSGSILTSVLYFNSLKLSFFVLDIHTMIFTALAVILGFQLIFFYLFIDLYTYKFNLKPVFHSKNFINFLEMYALPFGLILTFISVFFLLNLFYTWKIINFGPIYNPIPSVKLALVTFLFFITGVQTIFNTFFLGILNIKINQKT